MCMSVPLVPLGTAFLLHKKNQEVNFVHFVHVDQTRFGSC